MVIRNVFAANIGLPCDQHCSFACSKPQYMNLFEFELGLLAPRVRIRTSSCTVVSHLSRPVDLSENVAFSPKVVDLSHEKRST